MLEERMYVGIDVSSEKLDVSFLGAQEQRIRPTAVCENGPDGWIELTDIIVSIASQCGEATQVVCGMESTGNFHKRLEYTLRSEDRLELQVHVINPMAVKNFGKVLLKDCKTDKRDSWLIARYLSCLRPKPDFHPPEGFEELKEATRTRRSLIEDRTQSKNRLHKLLRYHFPGYRKQLGKELTKRLLVAIREMPSPDKILAIAAKDIAQLSTGKGHYISLDFAQKLQKLAEEAPRRSLAPTTSIVLQVTAGHILDLHACIAQLDVAIKKMLEELHPDQHLTSIPGIGEVTAAAILAEVGDVKRFPTATDFIGYCGLYPIVWESGSAKRRYKMTRKGNRMLKTALLVVSAPARQYNPVVAAFYQRLRGRGKSKKAAGGASARKLAELVYAILTKNEPWSDETASRGMAKAEEMANQAS